MGMTDGGAMDGGEKGKGPDAEDRDEPLTAVDDDEPPSRIADDDWDDSDEEGGATDLEEEGEQTSPSGATPKSRTDGAGLTRENERQESSGFQARPGRPERQRPERRSPPANLQELFDSEIPERVRFADEKLRQQLTGSILLKVSNQGERRQGADRKPLEQRYLFEWSGESASCKTTERDAADCVISISEGTLLRIAGGDLNAQVSMLSDKMRVEGQASLAVYFFNLVAPSSGSFI